MHIQNTSKFFLAIISCQVEALNRGLPSVAGHTWSNVRNETSELDKRAPYYRPKIDTTESIWSTISPPITRRSIEDDIIPEPTQISNHFIGYNETHPSTGFSMHIKREAEDTTTHPVIKREQERNRLSRRSDLGGDSSTERDPQLSLLRHHEELTKRGMESGLEIMSADLGKRGSNNFQVAAATVPTLANTVALDEDGKDVSYFSTVTVGSNAKSFRVVMDSGSSDLWVPASDCTAAACQTHSSLGASDSTTLKISTTPWKITYGSGAANGFMVQDTLQMAGMQMKAVSFGTASNLSSSFSNFPSDGIMGLGTGAASVQKVPTFVENLQSQGLIQRKMIGVNIQRAADSPGANARDGEISFGRVDTTKFTGTMVTAANVAKGGLWEAKLDGVYINGQSVLTPGSTAITGIIDTGTTLILAPPTFAMSIHAAIPGAQSDGQGSFAIPCTTQIRMAFGFGGTQFSIDPRDYLGAAVDATGVMCLSNISGQSIGTAGQFLVGDVFLKNVYTVFDADNNQIGFGAKSPATTTTTTAKGKGNNAIVVGDALVGSANGTTSTSSSSASPSGTASTGRQIDRISAHMASNGASRL